MTESRKHGPRLDDALDREAGSHTKGAPSGSRAEEWRESETPANDEPEVSAILHGDTESRSDIPMNLSPYEIEQRSRFSRYLNRTAFPANRKELIRAAQEAGAPDDVLEELHRLPSGAVFENAARAWAALDQNKIDRRF